MIIELKERQIILTPMEIPEPSRHFYIQYKYEPNTSHLLPRLFIGKREYQGDRLYIDLTNEMKTENVSMVVELLDGHMNVLHRYETTVPHVNYSIFGYKPTQPSFDEYVRELENRLESQKIAYEQTIVDLNTQHEEEKTVLLERITDLVEQGEVI